MTLMADLRFQNHGARSVQPRQRLRCYHSINDNLVSTKLYTKPDPFRVWHGGRIPSLQCGVTEQASGRKSGEEEQASVLDLDGSYV